MRVTADTNVLVRAVVADDKKQAHAAATLIAPDMGWDDEAASDQAAGFIEACQKELLTAGLELP